jgi:Mrp family chromosome partitioning ATPase/DUF971 family protein
MIKEAEILNTLRQIIDPDFHKDIVSLGFVKNIKIEGDKVGFDIALTTPACPVKSEFQAQAEQLVKRLPGVKEVNVNMTTLPSGNAAMAAQASETLKKVGSIIAVSSCKGGVGKSTVAGLFAMELAQRGFKVGLADADIHGPSIPTLFDITHPEVYVNQNKEFIPIEKHGLKIMSFGFLLGDAPAVMRGPIVTRYVQQMLYQTAWGELDYLFIDMPPGTGDVQLTITQSLKLNGAVIVTTPQTLSLVDVSRGILMFEKVSVPILGIVENMSYFICDNCSKKHYIFGGQHGGTLLDRFGLETLAEIPLLPQFTVKIDEPIRNEFIMGAVDKTMRALGKQSIEQKQTPMIKFDAQHVYFTWSHGNETMVNNRELRLSCRCALCINELTGEQILKPESIRSDIAPTKIFPLGNYAVGIEWNDGHNSGIYPYKTIHDLTKGTAINKG